MTAEIIQQMWRDTLGVTAQMTNQEWKVYKISPPDWSGKCISQQLGTGLFRTPSNFVKEVFATGGAYSDVVDWTEGRSF